MLKTPVELTTLSLDTLPDIVTSGDNSIPFSESLPDIGTPLGIIPFSDVRLDMVQLREAAIRFLDLNPDSVTSWEAAIRFLEAGLGIITIQEITIPFSERRLGTIRPPEAEMCSWATTQGLRKPVPISFIKGSRRLRMFLIKEFLLVFGVICFLSSCESER